MEDGFLQNKQLSTSLLIVLGIGAMIGLNVFNIPSELATKADAKAIIASWVLNIIGILSIVLVFKILSNKKRGSVGGVYAYAKTFTNEFGADMVAFGYYASTIFSVVFFFQSGMQSISILIPSIGTAPGRGLNLTQLVLASIILWYMSQSMFKGILEISNISIVTTAFKILPLVLIIIACFLSFDIANMSSNIQNESRITEIGSFHQQLRATTNSILWLFVGFEGLSVISGRVFRTKDIGSAIKWSFIITATLYFLVSMSSLGAIPIDELATLPAASTGFILERLVGRWGQLFIDFSMIVSVFGAIIIWCMFGVEILYLASKDKQFFDNLGIEKDGVPKNAVLFTVCAIQLLLICGYVFDVNFRVFDSILTTTLLVPYTITVLYCIKYVLREEHYENSKNKVRDLTICGVALLYIVWAMHSTGFGTLLIAVGVYTFGVIMYMVNKIVRRQKVFTKGSAIVSIIILIAGALSIMAIIKDRL